MEERCIHCPGENLLASFQRTNNRTFASAAGAKHSAPSQDLQNAPSALQERHWHKMPSDAWNTRPTRSMSRAVRGANRARQDHQILDSVHMKCVECPEPPRPDIPGGPFSYRCSESYFLIFPLVAANVATTPLNPRKIQYFFDCKPWSRNTCRLATDPFTEPCPCKKNRRNASSACHRRATVSRSSSRKCAEDIFVSANGDCKLCSERISICSDGKAPCPLRGSKNKEGLIANKVWNCPTGFISDDNRSSCGSELSYLQESGSICAPFPPANFQWTPANTGKSYYWCTSNSFYRRSFGYVPSKPASSKWDVCPLGIVPLESYDQC